MTNQTAAIKKAKTEVSTLYQSGHKQWTFNTWSAKHNAWWQGHGMPYARAVLARRNAVVHAALAAMGYSEEDIFGWADYEEGSAADLIDRYVTKYGAP